MFCKLTWVDLLTYWALFYLLSESIVTWNSYSWEVPLNAWLLGVYLTAIVGRTLLLAGQNTRRKGLLACLTWSLVFLIFPFLISWTITGTYWYLKTRIEEEDCLPDYIENWMIIVCLLLCYCWVFFFVIAVIWAFMSYYRSRYRSNPAALALLTEYSFESDEAMSRAEIDQLDEIRYERSGSDVCTIWLEEFIPDSMLTALPGCGHMFHKDCIE